MVMTTKDKAPTGLALMRVPFPENQISKLPKPTKAQTDEVRADFKKGIRCEICGQWHHPKVVHLDYVGHAALTDRLLDSDPEWNWAPVAVNEDGTPALDKNGGMWIRLTVCGVTRLGYGHADGKQGGDALKEVIGDCLITGTLITTARGDVPIESVVIGDLVPTRAGWKPVIDHWRSSPSAPVVRIKFSNGKTITGTPHHKVPTIYGEKRLSALRTGDIMHAWQDTENFQAPKKSNGLVGAIAATQTTNRCIARDTSWLRRALDRICTGMFMKPFSVKSLMGGTSTIKMRIGTTTALTTLLQYLRESTRIFTTKLAPGSNANAMNAGTPLPPFSSARDGVRQRVRSDVAGERERLTSLQESQRSPKTFNVMNAESHSSQQSRGLGFAQVHVVEASDAGLGEVWNISVEEVHEYVANGILVCNCLRNAAMRFGAALDLWHKGALHTPDNADSGETVEAQKVARDPRKIADGLLGAIAKAVSVADLDGMMEDGQKFAAALDWLESEHKPVAVEVNAAFDKRRGELITGGDEIPY